MIYFDEVPDYATVVVYRKNQALLKKFQIQGIPKENNTVYIDDVQTDKFKYDNAQKIVALDEVLDGQSIKFSFTNLDAPKLSYIANRWSKSQNIQSSIKTRKLNSKSRTKQSSLKPRIIKKDENWPFVTKPMISLKKHSDTPGHCRDSRNGVIVISAAWMMALATTTASLRATVS